MIKLIELRNYLLKPGQRDSFIKYFKTHFIDSQEEMGGYIPGLFCIKDEPDRFCWIRGFKDMAARSHFLPAFYGGKVWEQFGPAANDMMLEWHHVHLLKPVNVTGLSVSSDIYHRNKLIITDEYHIRENCRWIFTGWFRNRYIPFLIKAGIEIPVLWESEMLPNDFPRLPVIQDKNLFLSISAYENENEYGRVQQMILSLEKELGNSIFKRKTLHLLNLEL